MPYTIGQYLSANDLNSNEDAHTLGNGVLTGLRVIPDTPPSMDVDVEIGKAYVAGSLVEKVAVTTLTVSGADPGDPRKDIVVSDSAGTLSIVAGTPDPALPAANVGIYTLEPVPPNIPADSVILAEIWVPAGATEITGSEIYDKRVFYGRAGMAQMPDGAADTFLKAQGAGTDPGYSALVAGDIPDLDSSKITTGTGFPRLRDSQKNLELVGVGETEICAYTIDGTDRIMRVATFFRVITGATIVTVTVKYTNILAAEVTCTLVDAKTLEVGDYTYAPLIFEIDAGTEITLNITASVANQVFASGTIEELV